MHLEVGPKLSDMSGGLKAAFVARLLMTCVEEILMLSEVSSGRTSDVNETKPCHSGLKQDRERLVHSFGRDGKHCGFAS